VELDDYGQYTYYIRCKDKEGNKDDFSQTFNFEYQNPNPDSENNTSELVEGTDIECTDYKTSASDGECDSTTDCTCDADCPSGEDADCAHVPLNCSETKLGEKDGVCDNTANCVCDPDCPASGDNADADCANVTATKGGSGGNWNWLVILLIGLILIIIVVIIILMMKKNNDGGDDDVELP
jgi:hypothetical protein